MLFRSRGPEIILSRADPNFVIKLFKVEVSEIGDGTIEIKGIAREPGFRTKLAVWTRDEKVDPVGACVGLRGQRVKNIVRELNNEKVDIIKWSPNVKDFITNALAPAKLKTFEIDEARRRARILASEDQLSLAIGKRGQNVRLASQLTGWRVDIESETKHQLKLNGVRSELGRVGVLDDDQVEILVRAGFRSAQELADTDPSEVASILDCDLDTAEAVVAGADEIVGQLIMEEADRRGTPAGE